MATQVRAGQLFRYRSFHINKSQPLGYGSYGAVYKAKCDQLTCAAKVLHPTIISLDPLDPGVGKIMQRFEQECAFLESIRHPNIVQYLGMTTDPESRLPVLLMELLDESLTKMLEHSPTALPYFVEVDICHDIVLAVAYLHSNDIIHRDLSGNNVLIIAKRRAKVTDFGMSRISSAAPTMTPMTMCPGTLAYMPPEALREPPAYTMKLDCFSEGVILIQVCTRLWPEPGPRTKIVVDPRSPTGIMEMPVLEPERRQNHIAKIDRNHGLLPIAMDCLRYRENDRPSSEELCERLAGLKETREYRESMEQVEREQNRIAELERQIGEMQKLHDENRQQVRRLENTIRSKDSQVQQLQEQLRTKEKRDKQLSKQLKEQEEITAHLLSELPRTPYQISSLAVVKEVQEKEAEIKHLKEELKQKQDSEERLMKQIQEKEIQRQNSETARDELLKKMEEKCAVERQLKQQLLKMNSEVPKTKIDLCLQSHALKFMKIVNLKRYLGKGSYGEVYVVEVENEDKDFAAKRFKLRCFDDDFKKKCLNEITALQHFRHENIVCYVGLSFIENDTMPALLMEKMEFSLSRCLSDHTLSQSVKIRILTDVAKGLDYLHTRNPLVIHRDLTANNVLLDGCLRAKIVDFGNSKFISTEERQNYMNLTPYPGTREYSAPEVAKNKYDHKCDIFSFGHLSLCTLSGLLNPELIKSSRDEDKCGVVVGFSEAQRRSVYFEHLNETEIVTDTIKLCLRYKPSNRPEARELSDILYREACVRDGSGLRVVAPYLQSQPHQSTSSSDSSAATSSNSDIN